MQIIDIDFGCVIQAESLSDAAKAQLAKSVTSQRGAHLNLWRWSPRVLRAFSSKLWLPGASITCCEPNVVVAS